MVGAISDKKDAIASLDDKFWVWESLEEAIRPEIDSLGKDDLKNVASVFCINFKGS